MIAPSLGTRRFLQSVLSLVVVLLLGSLALWLRVDASLALVVLGAVGGLAGTQSIAGASHDKVVRVAMVAAGQSPVPPPRAPGGGP